jgi:type I restriction enzyme S subunit
MMESNFIQDISTLKKLPKSWKIHDFTDVFADISGGNKKFLKSDFLVKGKIAVVDQGKELIAGYVNEDDAIVKGKPPYIVFGDHTRILKYIDFPFVMGADGTKVFKVKDLVSNNEKYLFHFLKSLNIPDTGYNRHFKYLKSTKIPLPPLPQQQKIANILDAADALRQKDKALLAKYDELTQSLFLDMFGDPVSNPMGWDQLTLKHFGKILTGNTPSRSDEANYSSRHIEWIKTDNIKENYLYISQASEYLSEVGLMKARTVEKDAILVACIAGSIESIGRAAMTDRRVSFNQQINAIEPNSKVRPKYLYYLIKNCKKHIQNHASNGMKRMLSKGEFEKILMILPPLELQNQFAELVAVIEEQKAIAQKSLERSEELFNSLLQKAFKGEII